MLSRFKSAARILLKGDPKKKKRNPIPAITPKEVAEIKQFFPRDKFFIFGHARSGRVVESQVQSLESGTRSLAPRPARCRRLHHGTRCSERRQAHCGR